MVVNESKKFKIPWDLIYPTSKKDLCPLNKIGYYLKAVTEVNDSDTIKRVDVTKIWISKETEEILDKAIFEYLYLQSKSKKQAQKDLGWYKFNYGPAVDITGDFNFEMNYIYVEENFIK